MMKIINHGNEIFRNQVDSFDWNPVVDSFEFHRNVADVSEHYASEHCDENDVDANDEHVFQLDLDRYSHVLLLLE